MALAPIPVDADAIRAARRMPLTADGGARMPTSRKRRMGRQPVTATTAAGANHARPRIGPTATRLASGDAPRMRRTGRLVVTGTGIAAVNLARALTARPAVRTRPEGRPPHDRHPRRPRTPRLARHRNDRRPQGRDHGASP